MILGGFYSFSARYKSPTLTNKESLSFKNGYIAFDSDWIKNENNKNHLFLVRTKDGVKNFSSSLKSHSDHYTSSDHYELVKEDFFLESISSRTLPIAWAIFWDEVRNEISLVRDAFGTIPLYYIHVHNEFLAFSTDIPSLLNIQQVKSFIGGLNDKRAMSFLNGTFRGDKTYNATTIYSNIYSVLPSHISLFNETSITHEYYNSFDKTRWEGITSVEEFGDLFRKTFTQSVLRDTTGKSRISSHLSGGLDSSAICCLTREQNPTSKLYTFYNYSDLEYTNEIDFANEVAEHVNSTHKIISSPYNEIDSIILNTSLYGQPDQMMAGSSMHNLIIAQSASENCEVLLTGYDGDGIVGYGLEHIQHLYQSQNWASLKATLEDTARNTVLLNKGDYIESFKDRERIIYSKYFYNWVTQNIKKGNYAQATKLLRIGYSIFGIPPQYLAQRLFNNIKDKIISDTSAPVSILNASFSKQASNYNETNYQLPNAFFRDILFDVSIRFIEQMYIRGYHSNISVRHPFYDMDLYELCLCVPAKLKYGKSGLTRAHFRAAMKGILPENIRLRRDKATFDFSVRQTALKQYSQARDFFTDASEIWDYVDKSNLENAWRILNSNSKNAKDLYYKMSIFVSQTVIFSIWLESRK